MSYKMEMTEESYNCNEAYIRRCACLTAKTYRSMGLLDKEEETKIIDALSKNNPKFVSFEDYKIITSPFNSEKIETAMSENEEFHSKFRRVYDGIELAEKMGVDKYVSHKAQRTNTTNNNASYIKSTSKRTDNLKKINNLGFIVFYLVSVVIWAVTMALVDSGELIFLIGSVGLALLGVFLFNEIAIVTCMIASIVCSAIWYYDFYTYSYEEFAFYCVSIVLNVVVMLEFLLGKKVRGKTLFERFVKIGGKNFIQSFIAKWNNNNSLVEDKQTSSETTTSEMPLKEFVNMESELKRIKTLYEEGLITSDEYDSLRRKTLNITGENEKM